MGLAVAALATPSGDVAVFGPLRAWGTIGHFDVQLPAAVHRPGGPPLPATYVGRLFDLGDWPPGTAVLLRGATPSDLAPGTLFTADATDAHALLRASTEGSMQHLEVFPEVLRADLEPDRFSLVFPAPEQVYSPSPPGTALDQSVVEFNRRLDELAARPRGKKPSP